MIKNPITHERAEYEKALDAQLRELGENLDELRMKIADSAVDLQIALGTELDHLQFQRASLQERLDDLRAADESGWRRLRDGLDPAREDLVNGLKALGRKLY